ncbi:uncharacterized protein LOC107646842 [Arachis ipaensis]|uniref:uncharacterized protein LOC107646842 n=1 Tax=Arachis ipaensis TaxID=130454 RepID=UPI0007AF2FC7|nr:uncharacterized protein LOC107646842 [Arachis ipaensis]XP_025661369.1 uncharacterized protein LOC112756983 [Arachis hypogaea]
MKVLQTETLTEEITSYSFTKSIWKGFVPPRVELFRWFVLVGRVNTKERLTRLGVPIHSDNICVLCAKEVESGEHLFLLCEFTWQVWCTWLRSFGRPWVVPGTMKDLFASWVGMRNKKQDPQSWMVAFFAVIWNVWKKRKPLLAAAVYGHWEPLLAAAVYVHWEVNRNRRYRQQRFL